MCELADKVITRIVVRTPNMPPVTPLPQLRYMAKHAGQECDDIPTLQTKSEDGTTNFTAGSTSLAFSAFADMRTNGDQKCATIPAAKINSSARARRASLPLLTTKMLVSPNPAESRMRSATPYLASSSSSQQYNQFGNNQQRQFASSLPRVGLGISINNNTTTRARALSVLPTSINTPNVYGTLQRSLSSPLIAQGQDMNMRSFNSNGIFSSPTLYTGDFSQFGAKCHTHLEY